MRNVTKEEFYAVLYADKRDIMPIIVGRWSDTDGYVQEWRDRKGTGNLFGVTKGTDQHNNKTYQLVQE